MILKLKAAALRQIRNSDEVVRDLEARAERIASAAGPGMVVLPSERGKNRARVAVLTGTYDAMRAEATTRALTRAIEAGRG